MNDTSQISTAIITSENNNMLTVVKETSSYVFGTISSLLTSSLTEDEIMSRQLIDESMLNKLDHSDKSLQQLYTYQKRTQGSLDTAEMKTSELQAKFDGNMRLINERVAEIKKSLLNFHSECGKSILNIETASTDDIMKLMNDILTNATILKSKYGDSKNFEHIDLDGLNLNMGYYKAIELNREILTNVAEARDKETPFRKQKMEVEHRIELLQKEAKLIKNFKIQHAQLMSGRINPVVDGKPIHMIEK